MSSSLGATFKHGGDFGKVRFLGDADFLRARFEGFGTSFSEATFLGAVGFGWVTFEGYASFTLATFKDAAWFREANFEGEAWFGGANFEQGARFHDARFHREATFAGTSFQRHTDFSGTHFNASSSFDHAVFKGEARFDLARAAMAASAVVTPPNGRRRLAPGRCRSPCLPVHRRPQPGPVASRGRTAVRPHRRVVEGSAQDLAEEQHGRAGRSGRWRSAHWNPPACQPVASPALEAPEVPDRARLAALYRDLRKGREDAKDEPGAADFYYGECEMRRHDPRTPMAERLVLGAYWLLSGYGLRAWRALAALTVVVLLAGVMFALWGFPDAIPGPAPGMGRLPEAVRFSARSATALLRGPDRVLTPLGEWLEIGLWFAGPVLLGLAVLSVRGRVRR